MPFGFVTRTYLDQRLEDLRREVERGRVTEDQIAEWIDSAFKKIELEWALWQKKLLTLVASMGKQNKKAAERVEVEGDLERDGPGPEVDEPPPRALFRSRRGF